jgi:t-SNARE complex subunit (syntaxin)
MSVLEPIRKEDLNLKDKFAGKMESPEKSSLNGNAEKESGEIERATEKNKEYLVEKKEETYSKILSQVTSYKPASTENLEEDAKIVDAEKEVENKITRLVGLAKEKGVIYAVKIARKAEDNYTLDEFHDRLAHEFHAALVKEGLIKEI